MFKLVVLLMLCVLGAQAGELKIDITSKPDDCSVVAKDGDKVTHCFHLAANLRAVLGVRSSPQVHRNQMKLLAYKLVVCHARAFLGSHTSMVPIVQVKVHYRGTLEDGTPFDASYVAACGVYWP